MIAHWDLKDQLDKQIQDLIKLKKEIEKPPKQLKEIIEELAEPGINEIVTGISKTEEEVSDIYSIIQKKTLTNQQGQITVKEKLSDITKSIINATSKFLKSIKLESDAANLTIKIIKLIEMDDVKKTVDTVTAAEKAVTDAKDATKEATDAVNAAKTTADAAEAIAKAEAEKAKLAFAKAAAKTKKKISKTREEVLYDHIKDMVIKKINTIKSMIIDDKIIKAINNVIETAKEAAAAAQAPPAAAAQAPPATAAQTRLKKELETVKLALDVINLILKDKEKINNEIKGISKIIEDQDKADDIRNTINKLNTITLNLKKEEIDKTNDALSVLEADNTERKDKDSIIIILENVISRVNQLLTLDSDFENLKKEITELITYLNQQIQDIQKIIQSIKSSLKGTVTEIIKLIIEINQKIEEIKQRIQEITQALETLALSKSIIENAKKIKEDAENINGEANTKKTEAENTNGEANTEKTKAENTNGEANTGKTEAEKTYKEADTKADDIIKTTTNIKNYTETSNALALSIKLNTIRAITPIITKINDITQVTSKAVEDAINASIKTPNTIKKTVKETASKALTILNKAKNTLNLIVDVLENKVTQNEQNEVKAKDDAVGAKDNAVKAIDDAVKAIDDVVGAIDEEEDVAEDAIKTTNVAIKMVEDILKTFNKAIETAEDALKAFDKATETAEDALKASNEATETAEDALKKENINKVKTEIDKANGIIIAAKTEIGNADNAIKAVDAAIKTVDAAIKAAAAEIDNTDKAIKAVDAAIKAAKTEIDNADAAIKAADVAIDIKKIISDNELKKAKGVADKAKGEADKAKSAVDKAKSAADKANGEADKAKSAADAAKSAAEGAKGEAKEIDLNKSAIKNNMDTIKSYIISIVFNVFDTVKTKINNITDVTFKIIEETTKILDNLKDLNNDNLIDDIFKSSIILLAIQETQTRAEQVQAQAVAAQAQAAAAAAQAQEIIQAVKTVTTPATEIQSIIQQRAPPAPPAPTQEAVAQAIQGIAQIQATAKTLNLIVEVTITLILLKMKSKNTGEELYDEKKQLFENNIKNTINKNNVFILLALFMAILTPNSELDIRFFLSIIKDSIKIDKEENNFDISIVINKMINNEKKIMSDAITKINSGFELSLIASIILSIFTIILLDNPNTTDEEINKAINLVLNAIKIQLISTNYLINNTIYQYKLNFDIIYIVDRLGNTIKYLNSDENIQSLYDKFINYDIDYESQLNFVVSLYQKNNSNNILNLINDSDNITKSIDELKAFRNYTTFNEVIENIPKKIVYDDKKHITVNDYITEIYNMINILYAFLIVSVIVYVIGETYLGFRDLKIEKTMYYNLFDFVIKNKKYRFSLDQNNNIINDEINQYINFIFINRENLNKLIQIFILLNLNLQYIMFNFLLNNKDEIMKCLDDKKYEIRKVQFKQDDQNFNAYILELLNTKPFKKCYNYFFFIKYSFDDNTNTINYIYENILNDLIDWKYDFYSQILNDYFTIDNNIQNMFLTFQTNNEILFNDLQHKNLELYNNIVKNFIIENDDDNEDDNEDDKLKYEKEVYEHIKELKKSDTEFKNIKNEKLFNLIILNDFFNLKLFKKHELNFIILKQKNFNSDDNIKYKISNNEDEDEDEDEDKYKIKVFIFTLINILINKLSNIETVENKKNLIKNEFKYYLTKFYKSKLNYTKYKEKEGEGVTYGKDEIAVFNQSLEDIIQKYKDEINSSNIDFINEIADFLISNTNPETDTNMLGGVNQDKTEENTVNILNLALNEKGTIYWINNDYYKLMPDEEEIYKEYLNIQREQNEEYQEIFNKVDNDAQFDPEEMNNVLQKNEKINDLSVKLNEIKNKLEKILQDKDRKKKKINKEEKKIKKKSINDTKIRIDNNIVSLILILQELSNTDNYSSQNPKVQTLLNKVITGIQNYHSSEKKNNVQSNSIIKTLEDNFIDHFKSNRIGRSLNNNEMRMVDFTAQINNSLVSLIKENKVKNGDKFIVSRTNSIKDGEIYVLMDYINNDDDNLIVLLNGKNPKNGKIEKFKVNLSEDEYFKNNCDYAHLMLDETPRTSGKMGGDVLSSTYKYFNPNYNRFNF